MADQTERIILSAVDQTQSAVKSANAGIDSVEAKAKSAGKSVENAGKQQAGAIVNITNTTQAQIDKIVAGTERRLNALKSPLDRLLAQQSTALSKVAGDPAAVSRVTTAFGQLIAAEEKHNTLASKIGAAIRDPLGAAGSAVQGFLEKFGAIAIVGGSVAVALAATAKAAYELSFGASEAAEKTTILADQLGISIEEVQSLAGASKIAGTDIEGLVSITRRLSTTLVEGGSAGKEAVSNLQQMGVKVLDINGKFRSGTDILRDYSKHIGEFKDHATLVDNLSTIYGRTAISQLTLIKGINELEASAKAAGAVLSAEIIRKLAEANDRMDELGISLNALNLKASQQIILGVEFVGLIANDPTSQAIFKFLSGAIGVGVRKVQASNVEAAAKIKSEIPTEFSPGLLDDYAKESVKRGDARIAKFLAETSLDSLEEKVAKLSIQRSKASGLLAQGGLDSVAGDNIANFKRLGQELTVAKKQLADAQALPEARKAAAAGVLEAQAQELQGVFRIEALRKKALFESLNDAKIKSDINRKSDIEIATQRVKDEQEYTKVFEALEETRRQASVKTQKEISDIRRASVEAQTAFDIEGVRNSEAEQLRLLELTQSQTLSQKIILEQRKSEIQQSFAKVEDSLLQDQIQRQRNYALDSLKIQFENQKLSLFQYLEFYAATQEEFDKKVLAQKQHVNDILTRSQQEAAINSARLVLDHNRELFDSFKNQAGGVFDSLLTKGQNVFQVLGNTIKTSFLTAIKDVVSSQVAAKLTELVTGTPVTLQSQTPGAGPLGKIASALGLGAKPVFGSKLELNGHLGDVQLLGGAVPVVLTGAGGQPLTQTAAAATSGGSGGLLGALTGLAGFGGVGGLISARTPPFVGGAQSTITYGSGGSETFGSVGTGPGGLANIQGFGGILGGLKSSVSGIGGLLSKLGGLGRGAAVSDIPGGYSGAVTTGTRGIGGTAGGLALLGGGILAADGLRRGGGLGVIETTAGGALIGAKFGGPIGAAIGAAVGLTAGLIRLKIKGQAEKIIEKVRSIYGITIDKSFASDPIGKIIKANYGGDLEVGLRSPEVRNMLDLYAQSRLTTDEARGFPLAYKPYGVGLSLQGGNLYQTSAQLNGQSIGYSGGTASLQSSVDRLITGTTGGQGQASQVVVQNLQVLVNGQGAAKMMAGEIVNNPVAVGQASAQANKLSVNRQQSNVDVNTPGLLLA